jgi:hypothetical protein
MTDRLRVLPDERERWIAGPGITVAGAVERLREAAKDDGERLDVIVDDVRTLGYEAGPDDTCRLVAKDGSYPVRAQAFGQIANRVGAPAKFLASLPRDLHVPVVRWGLSQVGESHSGVTLRLAGTEVRAVVSHRYSVCDHEDAAEVMRQALTDVGLVDTASVVTTTTGLTMVMRTIWEGRDVPSSDGSRLSIGLDLTNGEAGNRSLGLAPVVWHHRAQGACRRRAWSRRHIGDTGELVGKLVEAVPEAMLAAEELRSMVLSASSEGVDDALAEAEALRRAGMSISEAREAIRSLLSVRGIDVPHDTAGWPPLLAALTDVTVYEIWLAIVESAGQAKSTETRLKIEDLATRYLSARIG